MKLAQEIPKQIDIDAVPPSTSSLAWRMAAAWSGHSVTGFAQDTATVSVVNYIAALQALQVVEDWLRDHGEEDEAAAVLAEREIAVGNPLHREVSGAFEVEDDDFFVRVMMLAEEMGMLTNSARNRGDAVTAAKYSNFESSLLQVAAGLQTNDIEAGK